jgi:O-succinylbenzoic acid--CoA ligase
MPLFHVGGLSILVRTALAGATAVIQPRFDEHAVVRAIAGERITHVSMVASMLARVLDAWGEAPCPASLRCVLLGGGPAPDALLGRAWRLGWPVSTTYGLTEACSQVATRRAGDRAQPMAGRLRALPGLEVCVREASGALRPAAAEGEILVRGASVAAGYVGHAAAVSAVDAEGWLATGDVGRLDAEGLLEVLDRRDDLIVSGGENVYPAEVESVLLEHAAVVEAAVVGRPDARFGARPVAYWVRRIAHPDVSASSLAAHVRSRLAGFKAPVEFIEVDALPRTAAGKLQRARVRALDAARAPRG